MGVSFVFCDMYNVSLSERIHVASGMHNKQFTKFIGESGAVPGLEIPLFDSFNKTMFRCVLAVKTPYSN